MVLLIDLERNDSRDLETALISGEIRGLNRLHSRLTVNTGRASACGSTSTSQLSLPGGCAGTPWLIVKCQNVAFLRLLSGFTLREVNKESLTAHVNEAKPLTGTMELPIEPTVQG